MKTVTETFEYHTVDINDDKDRELIVNILCRGANILYKKKHKSKFGLLKKLFGEADNIYTWDDIKYIIKHWEE